MVDLVAGGTQSRRHRHQAWRIRQRGRTRIAWWGDRQRLGVGAIRQTRETLAKACGTGKSFAYIETIKRVGSGALWRALVWHRRHRISKAGEKWALFYACTARLAKNRSGVNENSRAAAALNVAIGRQAAKTKTPADDEAPLKM
jgi:hypothetical protein